MNNIQKAFKSKAKRGLCMAAGGVVGEEDPYKGMSATTAAQFTNNPDVLNNANTAKWAAEEEQRQRSHPGQAFLDPVAKQDPTAALAQRIGNTVGDSLAKRFGPSTSPAVSDPASPMETTFQQDIDARQARMNGLRSRLGGFADGGVIGNDGLTDAQRAKLSGARSNLGVSNATPAPAPTPAPAAPAPAQQAPAQQAPSIGGAVNSIRERQRMLNNLATGGVIGNAAEYWANDNAEFEKTKPGLGSRVVRAINPMTGFGSAMGAMHTAAGNGDIPGMAMAGISAIPAFGVLRAAPATGAIKAGVQSSPSLGRTASALAGGATANAAADEYQAKKEGGYAAGGVAGAGYPGGAGVAVPATEYERGVSTEMTPGAWPSRASTAAEETRTAMTGRFG